MKKIIVFLTTFILFSTVSFASGIGGSSGVGGYSPPSFRGALVYLDATVSVSDVTNYDIAMTSESYDTDNVHDNVTNNTRLTVPAGVTKVKFTVKTAWSANTAGIRLIQIRKNASGIYDGFASLRVNATNSSGNENVLMTPVLNVVGGDYFEFRVYQDSGAALDLYGGVTGYLTWVSMEIIE